MNQEAGIRNQARRNINMNTKSTKIKDFVDLIAWKEGHKLALEIYKITRSFPKTELFGLTNQMQRCVVSITSNIAEGFSRISYKEKVMFFYTSLGSLTELQNQLIIARDILYLSDRIYKELFDQTIKVQKLLNGLIKSTKLKV